MPKITARAHYYDGHARLKPVSPQARARPAKTPSLLLRLIMALAAAILFSVSDASQTPVLRGVPIPAQNSTIPRLWERTVPAACVNLHGTDPFTIRRCILEQLPRAVVAHGVTVRDADRCGAGSFDLRLCRSLSRAAALLEEDIVDQGRYAAASIEEVSWPWPSTVPSLCVRFHGEPDSAGTCISKKFHLPQAAQIATEQTETACYRYADASTRWMCPIFEKSVKSLRSSQ